MTWLITGAAGYIGARVLEAFTMAGTPAVALDSLVSGDRDFVPVAAPFIHASTLHCGKVTQSQEDHRVSGVVHLAGYKYAGKSVKERLVAYEYNVTGVALLLKAMDRAGLRRIVFVGRRLRNAGRVNLHRGHPHSSRIAIRRN